MHLYCVKKICKAICAKIITVCPYVHQRGGTPVAPCKCDITMHSHDDDDDDDDYDYDDDYGNSGDDDDDCANVTSRCMVRVMMMVKIMMVIMATIEMMMLSIRFPFRHLATSFLWMCQYHSFEEFQ